ncbi:hypothetical protein SAMN06295974_1665 [Plantibacter flavus]|uniref:Uncharacterized protein n=1 Tax=Plantibacter flavus TaxID=150123 RepID=A0A3N2C8F0_9MICO|nr:hypothetical protein [Plantibacter sp. T3]ROR83594.1 hypothetical protein EDD42_3708 [Plantibacter flavus]SMG25149.1 hypothetical protein SAMN06295974_1665 [Plantibacter flavus]VXB37389.1 conserved exported hypothetical protein [Plantibacter sp. T3]
MKVRAYLATLAIAALLSGGSAVLTPSDASAVPLISEATSDGGFAIRGTDDAVRSIIPDEKNTSSVSGMSAKVSMEPTDRIVLSADARLLVLQDQDGGVLLSSANPTLEQGTETVPAKFVLEDGHLIVTPIEHTPNLARAACASSFWGNLIFNIGMAGVCAMLGIATAGPGGVACTMAVIGANLGIDWDRPC